LSATAHGSLWPSKDLLGRALPNLSVNSLRSELSEMRRRMERLLDETARGD
jgi:hypothetical protein